MGTTRDGSTPSSLRWFDAGEGRRPKFERREEESRLSARLEVELVGEKLSLDLLGADGREESQVVLAIDSRKREAVEKRTNLSDPLERVAVVRSWSPRLDRLLLRRRIPRRRLLLLLRRIGVHLERWSGTDWEEMRARDRRRVRRGRLMLLLLRRLLSLSVLGRRRLSRRMKRRGKRRVLMLVGVYRTSVRVLRRYLRRKRKAEETRISRRSSL